MGFAYLRRGAGGYDRFLRFHRNTVCSPHLIASWRLHSSIQHALKRLLVLLDSPLAIQTDGPGPQASNLTEERTLDRPPKALPAAASTAALSGDPQ